MVIMVTPLSTLPEPGFTLALFGDDAQLARAWSLLEQVPDPEIPVISVCELGIVRRLRFDGGRLDVDVTPTYSGCPATEVISADIRAALERGGFANVKVNMVLSPPWTTDAITTAGRAKLRAYGIAPPGPVLPAGEQAIRFAVRPAACPRCGAGPAERISEFGSSPCKALYRCNACGEPFDLFKPL